MRPRRNRISLPVPKEYGSYTFRIVMIPIVEDMKKPRYDFSDLAYDLYRNCVNSYFLGTYAKFGNLLLHRYYRPFPCPAHVGLLALVDIRLSVFEAAKDSRAHFPGDVHRPGGLCCGMQGKARKTEKNGRDARCLSQCARRSGLKKIAVRIASRTERPKASR